MDAWSPGLNPLATLALLNTTPIGSPPAIAFAHVVISGTVFVSSEAKNLPVRPNPVCTSSNIKRIPFSSQIFLSCGR